MTAVAATGIRASATTNPPVRTVGWSSAGQALTTLSTAFGSTWSNLQDDDIIFFIAADSGGGAGTLTGTNATQVYQIAAGYKDGCLAWVRKGDADGGNYGYSSANVGHLYFALRGLDPVTPIDNAGWDYFYSSSVVNDNVLFPNADCALLFVEHTGAANRDPALTSTAPDRLPFLPVAPSFNAVHGAWYTPHKVSQYMNNWTFEIYRFPNGTGGSGGDSWAGYAVLNVA